MSDLDRLQQMQGEWARATFPTQNPHSIVAHLCEEVVELAESHSAEEAADCLLLLLGHAAACGYSLWDAAVAKLAVNKARTWGTPDAHGVVHHTKAEVSA